MLGTQAAAASNNSAQQATEPNAMQASEVVEDAHEESQDPRLAWLVNLATEMGYSLQKTSIYNSELSQAITSKLINRLGGSVYQAAAFSLPTFPRSCAEKLLPPSLITEQTANVVTWKATTILEFHNPEFRIQNPESRFQIPDSKFQIADSRFQNSDFSFQIFRF